MTEQLDALKASGMCPHGNFPSSCKTCRAESQKDILNSVHAYAEQIRARLASLSENAELSAEQRELEAKGLELFLNEFALPLQEVLSLAWETPEGEVSFADVLYKHTSAIESAQDPRTRSAAQEALLQALVPLLRDMPVGNWDISLKQTAKTKKNNCSGSAALLSTMLDAMQPQLGIDANYVSPFGHALVMTTLADGRLFYVDGRNGVLNDVSDRVDVEDRGSYLVYGLWEQTQEMPFRFLPATKENWRLIVETYAGNMQELPKAAQGEFDAVLQTTASPEELTEIQAEAAEVVNAIGVSVDDIADYGRIRAQLIGDLAAFRESPDFGTESELWSQINAGQEHLAAIGERITEDPALRQTLLDRKDDLRTFLLGTSDTFDSGDESFTELLTAYREARLSARIILHKSDEEFAREIDAQLAQL